jgi:hypothetical protein
LHQFDLPLKRSEGGEMGLRFGAEPLGKVFEVFRDALSAGELNQQRHIGGRRLRAARTPSKEISHKRDGGKRRRIEDQPLTWE